MTKEELTNVFKYIMKKCDMLINDGDYEADAYTQNIVEDIAELCNHILDGDYGKLVEVKDVDLDREIRRYRMRNPIIQHREESLYDYMANVAKHFFELGLKAQLKNELL